MHPNWGSIGEKDRVSLEHIHSPSWSNKKYTTVWRGKERPLIWVFVIQNTPVWGSIGENDILIQGLEV